MQMKRTLVALSAAASLCGSVAITGASADLAGAVAHTAPATCTLAQLSESIGASQNAGGTIYYPIYFSNKTSQSCTLSGIPTVVVEGNLARNSPVGLATKKETIGGRGGVTAVVKNQDSEEADFGVVETNRYSARACAPARAKGLSITLPGVAGSVTLPLSIEVCTKVANTSVDGLSPAKVTS